MAERDDTPGDGSRPTPDAGPREHLVVPDRVRMPLLTLITQQSLDEDYQVAAERQAAGAPRAPLGRPPRVAAAVLAVFGVLVAVAFVQTTRNRDVVSQSRATLVERIESASDRRAAQEERLADLRDDVALLESSTRRLTDQAQQATSASRRLQVSTGFVPVKGEGVRIVVDQAPDASRSDQVKDRDLRLLVNGLFEAGAEAVAINGQRLTATSAIRVSGTAIEVNRIGVAPPFTVEAIGDVRTLQSRFAETSTGASFLVTADYYRLRVTMQNVDELALPAAPVGRRTLRTITPPDPDDRPDDNGGGGTNP
ncbi:DUF881 domain-containing protein [Nocardioides sp. C4-1]|uniref:DUF881 domain-containing protein n=1 Tax=Nocardioides sp. C4-1 TaxID=3151851 RepID=UPI00326544E3